MIPAFVLLVFVYALVGARVPALTAPLLFTLAGAVGAWLLPGLAAGRPGHGFSLTVAELGLVLVLFTDASRTDLKVLKSIQSLPARLLSGGLLLTLGLGAAVAKLVFPQLTIWEAAILSCILAPTDAGLGQAIVESPEVPLKMRQTLNVEAGLNDGLCVPFMLFALALAADSSGAPSLARLIYEQLALGAFLGLGIGLLGGGLLTLAERHGWTARPELAFVALPLLAMIASEWLGASMFIAAFVAGLAVQAGATARAAGHFTEEGGQLLNWFVFFLFGISVVRFWPDYSLAVVVYGVLSLTLVRMLPVALALIGTAATTRDRLFAGWFGPRGLASIVLALVYVENELHLPGETVLAATVSFTVLLSIFAHGLSVKPGIKWYTGGKSTTD